MKEKLIDLKMLQNFSPIFKKWYGPFFAKYVIKICGFNKINYVYDSAKYETGTDIEDTMIDKGMGMIRKVHNIEILKQFKNQAFITVSNHPYGHVDGIMLIGEVAKLRSDFKMMVNWMLGLVDIMQDHFIGVNPYDSGKAKKFNLEGIKKCLSHLKGHHPLGFFPAGAISNNIGNNQVRDREWQEGVIKLIKKASVPVIPVYISGQNSWFFNFLDKIDWRLRIIRLCHEIGNKKGKTVSLIFGDPVWPREQKQFSDLKIFGEFLQEKTYGLSRSL